MIILFPIAYVAIIYSLIALAGLGKTYPKPTGPSKMELERKQYWRDRNAVELMGLDPDIVPVPRS